MYPCFKFCDQIFPKHLAKINVKIIIRIVQCTTVLGSLNLENINIVTKFALKTC